MHLHQIRIRRALYLVGMVLEGYGSRWGLPCAPTQPLPVCVAHVRLHKDRQFVIDVWPKVGHSPLSRQTSPCNKPYMNLEGLDELSSSHTCPGHGCQVFIKFWREIILLLLKLKKFLPFHEFSLVKGVANHQFANSTFVNHLFATCK